MSADRSRLGRGTRRRGYTIVEVMVALSLLAIGAAGIVAMQRATARGNARARNLATANAVATTWMERLRNDGLLWTNSPLPTLPNTRWLNAVGIDFPTVIGNEGIWLQPTDDAALDISPMADVRGRDTFVNADAAYCTNVRLTQLLPTMIRAEVRVYWLRNRGGGTLNAQPLCQEDLVGINAALDRYHFIYFTSAVLRTDF